MFSHRPSPILEERGQARYGRISQLYPVANGRPLNTLQIYSTTRFFQGGFAVDMPIGQWENPSPTAAAQLMEKLKVERAGYQVMLKKVK